MTPKSLAAPDVAWDLWARIAGDTQAPEGIARAADQMCAQLRADLGRWIGDQGYRALLDRTLGLVRVEHPALGGLSCLGGDEPAATAAVRAYGAPEVTAGLVALVAALIELLGRIIGEEIVVHLVQQVASPNPSAVVRAAQDRGRDA